MNKNVINQEKILNELDPIVTNYFNKEKIILEKKLNYKKRFEAYVCKKCESEFQIFYNDNIKLFSDYSRT